MIGRAILAGAAALLLGACREPPPPPPPGNPLLWEIADADGQVEGWLYGTIHALPDGADWRDSRTDEAIVAADLLVVEVADLDDREELSRAFAAAGQSAGHPPLAQRVPAEQRAAIAALAEDTPYSDQDFRQIETWAAALILAQALRTDAESANGVDRALVEAFRGRRVEQLEGARRQFAIFDGLAEADQRAMLSAVVDESGKSDRSGKAVTLWLTGDEAGLVRESTRGILADPQVRDALLVRRNRDWAAMIEPMLARPERPLVAVGAAHLVGPDGLVALMRAEGYTVRRVR